MAEPSYCSPDPEIHFNINDEVGQGDLSPVPKQVLDEPDHTPVPEMFRMRVVPDSDRTPPFRRRQDLPIGDFDQPRAGMSLVMKPDPYNGKDDWDEYFSHFQDCAELGRWSDRTKLLFLAASLRDQARTYYMSLSPEDKESFHSLSGKLNQRFGSSRNQNRWLSKLEMRKRLPGESIAVLGDDIRQMAQRAYHNLDALAQEALALNQLYKIIPLEMKCRCIDKDCQTVAEAVDVIERYESILGSDEGKLKSKVRMVDTNSKPPLPAMDTREEATTLPQNLNSTLQTLIARLDRLESNETNRQRNNQRYPQHKNCFICNSPDHFMNSCPQRFQNQRPQRQPFNNSRARTNQGNARPLTQ